MVIHDDRPIKLAMYCGMGMLSGHTLLALRGIGYVEKSSYLCRTLISRLGVIEEYKKVLDGELVKDSIIILNNGKFVNEFLESINLGSSFDLNAQIDNVRKYTSILETLSNGEEVSDKNKNELIDLVNKLSNFSSRKFNELYGSWAP